MERSWPVVHETTPSGFGMFQVGRRSGTISDTGWVIALAMNPDGRTLIGGVYGGDLEFWDLASGKESLKIPPTGQVNCLALSPDGQTVAGGLGDGQIKLWDPSSGKEKLVLRGHPKHSVYNLAYSLTDS